jgi:FkbM family methyltransferase
LTEETIALNHVGHSVAVNLSGLGRTVGRFTVFTFAGLPHGHASATSLGRLDATPHDCELDTLDNYARTKRLGQIDILKMDVEGHELEVLMGGQRVLGQPEGPIVAFEVNPICLADRGVRAGLLQEVLEATGYTSFWRVGAKGALRVDGLSDQGGDYVTAKGWRMAVLESALASA